MQKYDIYERIINKNQNILFIKIETKQVQKCIEKSFSAAVKSNTTTRTL